MGKKDKYFAAIERYKERFKKEPSETLRRRLNTGLMGKEGAIAAREVLEERGVVQSKHVDEQTNPLPGFG